MPCLLYTREAAARFEAITRRHQVSPLGGHPNALAYSAWLAVGETPSVAEVEALTGVPFTFPCQQCWQEQEVLVYFGQDRDEPMLLCRGCLVEGLALFPSSSYASNRDLYDEDIYAWSQATAALIRAGQWQSIDPEALAEELELVSNESSFFLCDALYQILSRLLVWEYQTPRPSDWEASRSKRRDILTEHRHQMQRTLRVAPVLEQQISQMIAEEYPLACRKASISLQVAVSTFPVECPWSEAQIRDEEFFPST